MLAGSLSQHIANLTTQETSHISYRIATMGVTYAETSVVSAYLCFFDLVHNGRCYNQASPRLH